MSEVVVLIDSRSDNTVQESLALIERCSCEYFDFKGFGEAKIKAVSLATNQWVFSIDSDEFPDDILVQELQKLDLKKPAIYEFKRLNHYRGRPIKACGWYPDRVIRLFHKSKAQFTDAIVHESIKPFESISKVELLPGHLLHYSFEGSDQLLEKLLRYSTLYAKNYQGKPKSVFVIISRTIFTFIKFYIFKKGFIYGRDGFIISVMNAGGVFHKHWRAAEIILENTNQKIS